jgi:hypothetical protein
LEVVVELLPTHLARLPVTQVNVKARLDHAALFSDPGFDAEDFVTDVDATGDCLLVAVLGDQVLVEKSERLSARRRGQTDEEAVEVFERLPPQVVDRAVAFVGDDEVEGLNRDGGVVGDFLRLRVNRQRIELRMLFEGGVELLFPAQH